MQSLEAACEEDERSIKRFKSNRSSLPSLRPQEPSTSSSIQEVPDTVGNKPSFDIFAKLKELHQEVDEFVANSGSKYNTFLLEKLVAKERLNTLIVNLYPGNQGYSLAFRAMPCTDLNTIEDTSTANMIETKQWIYEVGELLDYISNEELPPFILDLLESQFSYLFYNGCIIAEVRDYRQPHPPFKCNTHHVLLRPTLKSLLADINNIVEEKPDWSTEEKAQLETQILMANEQSLCLESNNSIYRRVIEMNNQKCTWNSHQFRQAAKKPLQKTVNRKRKLDQFTYRYGMEINNFTNRMRAKSKVGPQKKKVPEIKPIPRPSLELPIISPPSTDVIIKEFKTYPRPKKTSDWLPQLLEEYVLETDMPSKDKDKPRVYYIKLSILQRPSNSEYVGELYLDRDHKENERNGVSCRFSLGSRANTTRYIHQFTEIFTESGRKSAKIKYGLSPGYKERMTAQPHPPVQAQNAATTQSNAPQEGQAQATIASPVVNGSITASVTVQAQRQTQATNVPILLSHLQGTAQTNRDQAINALATKLMNSAQEFQAAANAKQQQQQQQKLTGNHTPLLPQQIQTINRKLISHKMTIPNARVINHGNVITLNNNRLQELQQQQQQQTQQTISLNSANYANFTTVSVKQQRLVTNSENKSALISTTATDRTEIVATNTNSLLLEKLPGTTSNSQQTTTHFIQSSKSNPQQFMVQSPKTTTVLSPMSSPPAQSSNTINVQSLNIAQLQSIPGLQNLPGFALSLNVSSTGNIQGHPTSLIISLPVTTTTNQSSTTVTETQQTGGTTVNSIGIGGQTVVLANASTSNLAQLVSSSVKANQQNLRATTSPQGVAITQGGQSFQLLTPLQRPQRVQQTPTPQQSPTLTSRTIQRSTPITIKMAPPNAANTTQVNLPQLQQYQQICLNQTTNNILGKIRRKSNNSESQ